MTADLEKTELKTLDLSQDNGTEENKAAFYNEVLKECSKYGFVKFIGHGIEDELIGEAFELGRKFFDLPDDVKQAANRPRGPGPNRGYSAIGKEQVGSITGYSKGVRAPRAVKDVKESFDFGPAHDRRYPTPWPAEAEIPGFREFMQNLADRCDQVHLRIMRILETALGLPDSKLVSLCDGGNGETRVAHYPAIDIQRLQTGNTFRIAEHTDTGTLTLLFQDSIGGLEVERQDRDGQFMPVMTSKKSEMIVNVGDTLQRWTGKKLRSANHRVVAPQAMEASSNGIVPSRFSFGFFGKANPDAPIRTLEEFVDPRQSAEDMDDFTTANDYYVGLLTKTHPEVEFRT